VCNQLLRHHRVMHVPGSQRDVDRTALRIDEGVKLR
jgi:hypothetical protein